MSRKKIKFSHIITRTSCPIKFPFLTCTEIPSSQFFKYDIFFLYNFLNLIENKPWKNNKTMRFIIEMNFIEKILKHVQPIRFVRPVWQKNDRTVKNLTDIFLFSACIYSIGAVYFLVNNKSMRSNHDSTTMHHKRI